MMTHMEGITPIVINSFKDISYSMKLCSEKYLDEELNFLVDMFVENGYD